MERDVCLFQLQNCRQTATSLHLHEIFDIEIPTLLMMPFSGTISPLPSVPLLVATYKQTQLISLSLSLSLSGPLDKNTNHILLFEHFSIPAHLLKERNKDKLTMFLSSALSNSTSMSEEGSASSGTRALDSNILTSVFTLTSHNQYHHQQPQPKTKKKRNQPGNPDPDAEVIALSPKTLMATNRFVCEICNKGFQRDQNLQLHRRGHNLPWKLRQRSNKEAVKKRVYVCPEPSCIHHHPSRALGDLTGIKKHFSRKHGEKKWKCDKCSKRYAVQSDWKAHVKTCGTREYRCDCGTLFSRKDSFITHRAFCDALAEETAKLIASNSITSTINPPPPPPPPPSHHPLFLPFPSWNPSLPNLNPNPNPLQLNYQEYPPLQLPTTISTAPLSATALLQRATAMGPMTTTTTTNVSGLSTWHSSDRLTRDFLGGSPGDEVSDVEELLPLTCLDLVTSLRCPDSAARHFSRFPPVTGTWGDC